MKVSVATDNVERGGLAGEKSFGIVFDAKMAKILSDGLYADKIGSIIREICCNAHDAHVQVGNPTEPFDVHLPNMFEPWFSVQDRGPGLDPQQVRNIYTIYGCSTKTDSNDVIGQLGLGSKSPFSYTDAFTVVSVKNGRRNVYSMFKDESGMPSCAAMGPGEDTTEPNGVRVEIPVATKDFKEFSTKCCTVLRWFKTTPNIVGATVSIVPPQVRVQGQGWFLEKNNQRNAYGYYQDREPIALMGNVAYPIDYKSLTGSSELQRSMLTVGPVFEFDIGDLEVAASREALGYDARTIKAVLDRCTVMANELARSIEQQITACSTLWQAKAARQRLLQEHNLGNVLGKYRFKWQGVEFDNSTAGLKISDLYTPDDYKHHIAPARRMSRSYCKTERIAHGAELRVNCDNNDLVFVMDNNSNGLVSKLVHYRETHSTSAYFIIFRPSQLKTEQEILNMLGNPPCVVRSNDLPKPPTEARSSNNTVSKYTQWNNNLELGSQVDDTVDLADGGFYIPTERWNISSKHATINNHNIGTMLAAARDLGIIPADTAVYTGKGRSRTFMTSNSNWVNIVEYIEQAVHAMDSAKFAKEHAECEMIKQISLDRGISLLYKDSRVQQLNCKTSMLARYFTLLRNTIQTYTDQERKRISNTEFLYNIFNKPIPSVQVDVSNQNSLTTLKNRVHKQYPMIFHLTSSWNIDWHKETVRIMIFDYVHMVDSVYAQQNHNVDYQAA